MSTLEDLFQAAMAVSADRRNEALRVLRGQIPTPNNASEHDTPAPEPPAMVPARPEFIRLPLNGPCPWTGLTRSKLNELILPCRNNEFRPPVRSVSLAPPGKTKGVRLIYLQSLLDYLHRHSQGGA